MMDVDTNEHENDEEDDDDCVDCEHEGCDERRYRQHRPTVWRSQAV
jgi:hypothetical protein